ncbi:hypothetical protein BRADI_3g11175v3 [Brachypodium distachyon]|uniref:Uncharacterized protein n=1 Tax=Brachypodium distachyon TaxID=15368 RepID=A0A0Q3LPU2_BRADI|nr:hypothetical protein BRADI_3g11175v3 [Brachypodium distachyon]
MPKALPPPPAVTRPSEHAALPIIISNGGFVEAPHYLCDQKYDAFIKAMSTWSKLLCCMIFRRALCLFFCC